MLSYFFTKEILKKELGEINMGKKIRKLPVVLTKQEVQMVLDNPEGAYKLMASLMS